MEPLTASAKSTGQVSRCLRSAGLHLGKEQGQDTASVVFAWRKCLCSQGENLASGLHVAKLGSTATALPGLFSTLKELFRKSHSSRLASAAGSDHTKCPLCNSREAFQQEMLRCGIYIPDKDAEWELEEGAFQVGLNKKMWCEGTLQDLYTRHSTCDAPSCTCPHGRGHQEAETEWELVLCELCAAQVWGGGIYGVNEDFFRAFILPALILTTAIHVGNVPSVLAP